MTLITGNTYPVKGALRALGGQWDGRRKGWQVPDDKAEDARNIVACAPASTQYRGRRSYGSNYTRFSSGAEVFSNRAGRCEDAPCCGCCS